MPQQTPHLLQLLALEYFNSFDGAGQSQRKINEASEFLQFAADYLDKNRATTLGMAGDNNFSFNLRNGKTVMLSPSSYDTIAAGSMNPQGQSYVKVSQGLSQAGMNGVADTSGIPVDGIVHDVPRPVPVGRGLVVGEAKDFTKGDSMTDFTRPGGRVR